MRSTGQVILLAGACLLLTALALVKTEVGQLDYASTSMYLNFNVDGVLTQTFQGVMQDVNNNFLVSLGGSMIVRFAAGSTSASLFAGLGASSSNGVQATAASMTNVVSLAGDTVGNVYLSDQGRHCIRRIGTDGVINTFAGTCGTSGSAIDSVAATSSTLNTPRNIFYHTQTNNLYIADSANHRIRMVSVSTNIITTVMGTTQGDSINVAATSAQINTPSDVWVDASGAMVVADNTNYRLVRATSPSAIVTRFAGVGGSSSTVSYPSGIAATSAQVGAVTAVTGDTSGNVYFLGGNTGVLFRRTSGGTVFSYPFNFGVNGVIDNSVMAPFIFFFSNRIILSADNKLTISCTGASGLGGYMAQIVPNYDSNSIISVIAGYAASSTRTIPATSMMFRSLSSVWANTNGELYIVDATALVIVKSSSGVVTSVAGTRGSYSLPPTDTATALTSRLPNSMWAIVGDTSGNLYFSHGTGVSRISSSGILSVVAGTTSTTSCANNWAYSGAATSTNLCATRGVALSTSGLLYFSDDAFVIRRLVLSSGILSTIVGGGVKATSSSPVGYVATVYGLWLDAPRSFLYATDELHVVRRINLADGNPNSTVTVYAGQLGVTSNAGNNLPATSSGLNAPRGLCGSTTGDIYITQNGQFYNRVVFASSQVMQYYVGTGSSGEGGENTAPLSTPLLASLGCTIDAARDTLYYGQTGSSTSSVRSSSPLAVETVSTSTPSRSPTRNPTATPSTTPSCAPTRLPTVIPTELPTMSPSMSPSAAPSMSPSQPPTLTPSSLPTTSPTVSPSITPTISPSRLPTVSPTAVPSTSPSISPSQLPTISPTEFPSVTPSIAPSQLPSVTPTLLPSASPSISPSLCPTVIPTPLPSVLPTVMPSAMPTITPSISPSQLPTVTPSDSPSVTPSISPSQFPTVIPTPVPSVFPTVIPSAMPSVTPSISPSQLPTVTPSDSPSVTPSISPSATPSVSPSQVPTPTPTVEPSQLPSVVPTVSPSCVPTVSPTQTPSVVPSVAPSQVPSITPTQVPSVAPTRIPTVNPSVAPSTSPSLAPTMRPSEAPSVSPTVRTFSSVRFESTFAFKSNTNGKSSDGQHLTASSKLRTRALVPYELSVADQQAIVQTQAEYLETDPSNIVYMSAQEDDVELIIYAKTLVTLHLVDYPELNDNATQLAQEAKAVLTEAVQEGTFVAALVTKAAELNSTSFSSSIITVVLFSDPVVFPAPDYSDDEGLSVGQVVGLVVGCIVGTLLLMLGTYAVFAWFASRKSVTDQQEKRSSGGIGESGSSVQHDEELHSEAEEDYEEHPGV
eukprot:gene27235-32904_t